MPAQDRPKFAGRRRLLLGGAALALPGGIGYLLASDAGFLLPGSSGIRESLDAWGWSIFRRVPDDHELAAAAANHRRKLVAALLNGLQPSGWIRHSLNVNVPTSPEVWTHAQSMAALARCPELTAEQGQTVVSGLLLPFSLTGSEAPGRYGWHQYSLPEKTHYASEPAAEMACGLTLALVRRLARDDEARADALRAGLKQTCGYLGEYHSPHTGTWTSFPIEQIPPQLNSFVASIVLRGMIEAHTAGITWFNDRDEHERRLRKTAERLAADYHALGGWRGIGITSQPGQILDGLTLQAFAALSAAEDAGVYDVPRALRDQIPRHLEQCGGRHANWPVDSWDFQQVLDLGDGRKVSAEENVKFLWYPYAVENCALYLRRARVWGAPEATQTAIRRVLAHLLIEIGDAAVASSMSELTYRAAELLFCLATIPPP